MIAVCLNVKVSVYKNLGDSYARQAEVILPPPTAHCFRGDPVENSEPASVTSNNSYYDVAEAVKRHHSPVNVPAPGEYLTFPAGIVEEACLQISLQRRQQIDEDLLDFILSIDTVAKFIQDKGKRFNVLINVWEYETDGNLKKQPWYHGNIDKEEARRRLGNSHVSVMSTHMLYT